MRDGRLSFAVFSVLAALLPAGFMVGCFSANVDVDSKGWQKVASDYREAYAGSGSERDRAVQGAREAAIEAGLKKDQLSDYSISTRAEDKSWWVGFRLRNSEGKTWPARFLVRVGPDGRTVLYRNPDNAPLH